jgi:hypothetical protein
MTCAVPTPTRVYDRFDFDVATARAAICTITT